jgi:hypothetical protein
VWKHLFTVSAPSYFSNRLLTYCTRALNYSVFTDMFSLCNKCMCIRRHYMGPQYFCYSRLMEYEHIVLSGDNRIDDGSSKHLRNIVKFLRDYTVQYSSRLSYQSLILLISFFLKLPFRLLLLASESFLRHIAISLNAVVPICTSTR